MAPSESTNRPRVLPESVGATGETPRPAAERRAAGGSPDIRSRADSRAAPALHAIPANVAVLDGRGQIIAANEAWHRLTARDGLGPRFLPGLIDETLIATLDDAAAPGRQAILLDAILAGQVDSYEMEYPVQGPDGQRWYRLVVSPMSVDGDSGGGVVMQVDITTRKEAEIAMLRAEAQARVADQAKTDFLSNLSHELRTPLNAVIGFAQMLEGGVAGTLSDKQAEYVRDIRASGAHLLRLIDNLLDLSPAGASGSPVATEAVSLADAVADARRMLDGAALAKGLRIVECGLDALPPLNGDPRTLRQIALQLLSNAVKFTPDGGTITVAAQLAGDGDIELIVEDTGKGIPIEEIDYVFEPFYRTRDTQLAAEGGAGLGLTLVRRHVEAHGGTVSIDSATGVGTTVVVRLPRHRLIA
ncbi:MAG: ATP-binding protein [Alphaproteobacteria bacterium]